MGIVIISKGKYLPLHITQFLNVKLDKWSHFSLHFHNWKSFFPQFSALTAFLFRLIKWCTMKNVFISSYQIFIILLVIQLFCMILHVGWRRKESLQLLNFNSKELLNKPYVNEVTLSWQKPPLKCVLNFWHSLGFRSFNTDNLGSVGQRAAKLPAIKLRMIQPERTRFRANWFKCGWGQAADFFLRPPTFTADNFKAVWPTDP